MGFARSFQPKLGGNDDDAPPPAQPTPPTGRNVEQSWRGQTRNNETHASITDLNAQLARKSNGQASIVAYAGHMLMDNRNGLLAHSCLTHATATAERDVALVLVDRLGARQRRIMLGADKGYDVLSFVQALRQRRVTPQIASRRPARAALFCLRIAPVLRRWITLSTMETLTVWQPL